MEIIPAVDLRSGRCVRLYQGDYNKETVYSDDPVGIAARWWQEGALRLHVVDLDAAAGEPGNLDAIQAIANEVGIPVQVGGGIRTPKAAEILLSIGVDRIVLGTAAVEEPELVSYLCETWGGYRVIVAVDARDGRMAIRGWKEDTSVDAIDVIRSMEAAGVERFIYTDISRDGTLTEPNYEAVEEAVRSTVCPVLASGGVSSTEHVVRLASMGVEGAIIGRALYSGDIDLRAALKAAGHSGTGA